MSYDESATYSLCNQVQNMPGDRTQTGYLRHVTSGCGGVIKTVVASLLGVEKSIVQIAGAKIERLHALASVFTVRRCLYTFLRTPTLQQLSVTESFSTDREMRV
jgi:hypothetical protein